jgi:hypothetical protein
MTSQPTQAQTDEAVTQIASSPQMFSQIAVQVVENEQMAPQVVSPTQQVSLSLSSAFDVHQAEIMKSSLNTSELDENLNL